MGMPTYGAPISAPEFRPIPQTQPTAVAPPPAPRMAPDTFRRPGTAYGLAALRAGMSDQPYEPPAWATQLLVGTPDWQAQGSAQQAGYQRPGLPERLSINPFGSDPLGSFLGGDAGVALGMVPGEQRGGAYRGIATTPMTLANMSTWGREGLVALMLSIQGKSDYYTPEPGATFGQQPTGNIYDAGLDDALVRGINDFGNLVWQAFDAPLNWFRNSNAFNRGKAVRSLFATGSTTPFLIEGVTSAIFGGSERFTLDALRAKAAQQGIDYIDAIAKAYDLTPGQVAAIAAQPGMSDAALGQVTDGSALSVDPAVNLALEGAMQLALLGVGGAGIARGAAALSRIGELPGALGAGLRGVGLAEGAGRAAQAARTAGYIGRKALQVNSFNTAAGWTVRGFEWGIKQLAIIAGNDEVVRAMDRLLWTQPFSMNPGWNLIDGFSSHPIDALRNLRRGQVAIGRRGTPGYVGQLDLRGLALREGATGEVMTATIAGRTVRLGRDSGEYATLGRLRDLSPDDMHTQFFARLGWSRESMERLFGEGNEYDLTWDDARNALFHVALEAVREGRGAVGRAEGLDLPTMAERTAAFVRGNARGSLDMLNANLTGKSTSMLDLFRRDFWDLAKRDDSRMAATKAPLGGWDPQLALVDFGSWVRASKVIRRAIEEGVASPRATAAYRRTINREFIARWRAELERRFQPDERVPLTFIDQLKKLGGAVELRGRGGMLVRGRQASYTRRQLEEILDDVLVVDEAAQRAQNAIPREQAAAYRRGFDPGQDPIEDARVAGIGPQTLDTIRRMQARTPDQLTTPPPPMLLRTVAKDIGRTVDSILREGPARAWQTVFDWLEAKMASAGETAATRTTLDSFAQALRSRISEGRADGARAGPMVSALGTIRDELLTPVDPRLASHRPGLWERWRETAQEAVMLAQEVQRHLDAPERDWRVIEVKPGQRALLPAGLGADVLRAWQRLIDKALDPGNPQLGLLSEFDRQRLADPAVHPFLKADILGQVTAPGDRAALASLTVAIGGDPREAVLAMVGDAGLDVRDTQGAIASMTAGADGYVARGDELGAMAAQLARRFKGLGGAYSDELADTMDRVLAQDAVYRAAQPRGRRRQSISAMPMDPDASARQAQAPVRAEHSRARAEVRTAEARLARAEADLAGIADIPGFDPETMMWARHRLYRTGKAGQKRAMAETAIAELRAAGEQAALRFDPETSGWEVLVARPRVTEPPPPRPTPTDLNPLDSLDAVRRLHDEFLAEKADSLDLISGPLDQSRVADPAYQPAEMARVRAYLETRREQVARDIADNPRDPAAFGTDRRLDLLQSIDNNLAAFARRDAPAPQAALEEAAVAPDATPEQAPSRAMDADEADVAEEALPEPVAPPAEPVYGATGSFQDPRVEAARPIPVQHAVVEAGDLITSRDPGYPQEFQQREWRQQNVDRMAAAPDERMLGTQTAGEGAPVVLPDGRTVFAGNHRAMAMRQATDEAYDTLRAALLARSAEFGIDPGDIAGMRRPVLVRILPEGVADPALALAMNRATGDLKAENIARTINDALTADDWATFNPGSGDLATTLRSEGNADFLGRVQRTLPESERGRIRQGGEPTAEAVSIIKAAAIGKVLGDPSSPLVTQLATTATPELGYYGNGFVAALGRLLRASALMGQGRRPVVDIADPLRRALSLLVSPPTRQRLGANLARALRDDPEALARAKESVRQLSEAQAQQFFHGIGEDPVAGSLGWSLYNMRSGSEVADFLEGIAREVDELPDPTELTMFDLPSAPPSFVDIANRSIARLNEGRREKAGATMFGVDEVPLIAGPDGTTIVRDAAGTETARLVPVVDDARAVVESETPILGDVVLEGTDWGEHAAIVDRTPGRVVLRAETQAEADALTAYLAGTGEPLPRRYRVVDGVIEPIGDIRGQIAERIFGRYRAEESQRAGARYLTWRLTQEGVEPPTPANIRKFVDSEIDYHRTGRPVPSDPDLPGLRQSLAGRDFEVQVGRPSSAPGTVFYHGSGREGGRASTGRPEWDDRFFVTHDPTIAALYGPDVREVRLRPGAVVVTVGTPEFETLQTAARATVKTGRLIDEATEMVRIAVEQGIDVVDFRKDFIGAVVVNESAVETGGRPAATEIHAGTQVDIDPDFERATGLPPEHPTADADARAALAEGVHRVVVGSDEVAARAAQRASGAPVARDPDQVIVFNRPSTDERIRMATDARDAARAQVEAANARLAGLGAEPAGPPVRDVLSGSELDLWQRYHAQTGVTATGQPRDVGSVMDALASLDLGLPPVVGTMTDLELETLRGALLRTLHARLDDLGAAPSTGPARRAGVGKARIPGQGTRVETAPEITSVDDLSADLAAVVRELQGRVYEAEDALAGWEGTQYEIGALPTRSTSGGPLAPRIPGGVDWMARLDELVPGLADELVMGRKRAWPEREADARWAQWLDRGITGAAFHALRSVADTAFGARPERLVVKQAIDRFTTDVLRHLQGDSLAHEAALRELDGIVGAWHEMMGSEAARLAGFQKWRRVGLVPDHVLESTATAYLRGQGGPLPQWYASLLAEAQRAGRKTPLADAWRQADNRIRGRFAEQAGGMSAFLDSIYDSRLGRTGHTLGRNLTVGYHVARFLMDLRWLGLEVIEAPTLTLFKEGPGAMLEGLGKGRYKGEIRPMFVGRDQAEAMRTSWAWWLSQSDPGGLLRTRERYILAIARRHQEAEFPRAMLEVYHQSADVRAAVNAWDGGDPMAWLRRLDADWELAAKRGQPIDAATAERLFRPWLERGVISPQEFDEFVRAGRYTGHPELDRELARVADPRLTPLLERIAAINEQGWNDAARLIFGQTDRSNIQRLANHPLLYWPISYQIKATKWLGGLLFDRAFGIDTGMGGATVLGILHEQHRDRMRSDPEYATAVTGNPTLLFFAQMLFPITPWDIGVSLSPITRLWMDFATQEPGEGYARNIFSLGSGYTYFSLLPRLLYEQSGEDSYLGQGGLAGEIVQRAQRFAPYSVPIAPRSTSELTQAEQAVYRQP